MWGFAALVLVPVAWWYAWSGHLLAESGISFMGDWRYGTDKWGDWKLAATGAFWNRILFARLAGKHLTWAGFVIFAWGLFLKRRRRAAVFDAWLVAVLVATAIASRGSWVHEHYQLWFVPPAAAIMGRTFGRKWRARLWRAPSAALVTFLLAGFLVMSAWRYLALSAGESPEEAESWRLAMIIRDHTEPGDLVVSMDNKDPTALYHARRRGWNAHVNDLAAGGDAYLGRLAARGARFLAARHDEFMVPDRTALARRLLSRHRVVDDNGAVFILRLGAR
jgi:hypothetical protein